MVSLTPAFSQRERELKSLNLMALTLQRGNEVTKILAPLALFLIKSLAINLSGSFVRTLI
jgi:hypothetical protein